MSEVLEFRSDNSAGVAPEILHALSQANHGSALAYGKDECTEQLRVAVAQVFENPNVSVFPVVTGTAANAIGLSAMCQPWAAVLCHETAHILRSEGGATSMFGSGVVMRGLPGDNYLLDEAGVEHAFATTRWDDAHHSQPAVLSLTNPTDLGSVYPLQRIRDLSSLAKARGLRVHMDGARIANAIDRLGCQPADLTWRAGVDMLSLGATKNGVMTADAIICFDEQMSDSLRFRLKRAGQVASKMRFQSVQLLAYLSDGLWLRLAKNANRAMQRLAHGLSELGFEFLVTPEVNMAFVKVPEGLADSLEHQGVLFYRTAPGIIRLVTSFQTTEENVDRTLEIFTKSV